MAAAAAKIKDDTAHYERAGPALLAMEPAVPDSKKQSESKVKEWGILRGHLEGHVISLRNWRQSWWTQNWADLAQYIMPRRSIWLTQSAGGLPTPNNMTRGQEINSAIVDPTATYAVRVCSAGLVSGLASPSRPWFKVIPAVRKVEIDTEAREWLDETEDRIYTVLAGSNFYNSFAQECEDLVVYGTAPNIMYEDEKDLLRCYNPVIGEYYLSSGATLRVDGLFRTFVMTISQIVDFFGVENCSADVQKLWQAKGSSLDVERIIGHAIEPNFGIGSTDAGKLPDKFTWREVYWLYGQGSEQPLSMRGFIEQPFTAARWSTQSNDSYGRSVGMDVLPDVIQLQVETRRKAEAIEKQVRPPLIADAELKNQPASVLPGHVTFVQGLAARTGMRPIYEVNPDINAMMQDLQAIQQRIQRGFFNDLFLMLEQAPNAKMTAYEVAAKMSEKLQVLGPVIENLLSESLKPKLKRIFGIMKRKGLISEPPGSLQGIPLDIEFVSMLAQAQKASATSGMERIIALVGNMVAVYPEAKDSLNPDTFIQEMNNLLGNPQKILNGPEVIDNIREKQQKALEQQNQMAQLQQGVQTAGIAADAANVLSKTEIGAGQTAVSAMLGSGG